MSTTLVRRALPIALLTTSLFVAGCSASHNAPTGTGSTEAAPSSRPSRQLPDGIGAMGSTVAVADGSWTVRLQGFTRLPPGAESGSPAGWNTYTTRLTLTNRRDEIATAPDTELTARYGELGRQAEAANSHDTAATQSAESEPVRVRPDGSVTTQVRLSFPAYAGGQRVTVTAETTQEGLAEPELLFFEGTLPGRATAASSEAPRASSPAGQGVTPLGQWHADSVRLSTVSVSGRGSTRTAELELSVANRGTDPMTGLGTTLRVFTGQNLHLAATIHPVYGYHDAAIAPHRTATQTVSFRVPSSAVGGPLTIEAVGTDGARVTFEGRLG
jgi:hypothetical protein